MRFAVAVKQVPDTAQISVDENGSLVREGVPAVLNPYDEYALGRVLDIREDGDEVVVFTMGPPQAEQALRRCLELGADRAYLITDRAFGGSDVWATARALSAFAKRFVPDADMYVFGRQAIDGDTGQVPYEFAQMVCAQQFAYTESVSRDGDAVTAVQNYGDMRRTAWVPPGSVVSFGAVDPNGMLPTIRGFLDGSAKPVEAVDRVALGLGVYSIGLKGSLTRIVRTQTVTSSRRNRKVAVSDPSRAAELLIAEAEAVR